MFTLSKTLLLYQLFYIEIINEWRSIHLHCKQLLVFVYPSLDLVAVVLGQWHRPLGGSHQMSYHQLYGIYAFKLDDKLLFVLYTLACL